MTPPAIPLRPLSTAGVLLPTALPEASALDAPESLAGTLARCWLDAGVAAHAARAAQAEFAARLLRLEAPPPLRHGAARALLDEAAISAACLDLARRYGAAEVALAPIPKRELPADGGRNELVLGTLRRGCIAATVESCCAREALEHCQEAAAREVLLQLEHGRARSAQLAWRFLSWALRGTSAELADQVRVAVLTALGTQSTPPRLSPSERQLSRHGILGGAQRFIIEQRVLREVVLPCMENALARARGGSAA
jgi:hypothetical protein